MAERRFRTSVLGYNKKDVNKFINDYAIEADSRIKQRGKEAEDVLDQNRVLKEENMIMKATLEELEKERSLIATAMIRAEKEAKKILSEAETETQKEKVLLEKELVNLKADVESAKAELNALKAEAVNAIDKYKADLDKITLKY